MRCFNIINGIRALSRRVVFIARVSMASCDAGNALKAWCVLFTVNEHVYVCRNFPLRNELPGKLSYQYDQWRYSVRHQCHVAMRMCRDSVMRGAQKYVRPVGYHLAISWLYVWAFNLPDNINVSVVIGAGVGIDVAEMEIRHRVRDLLKRRWLLLDMCSMAGFNRPCWR